jgi:hypothetical protein
MGQKPHNGPNAPPGLTALLVWMGVIHLDELSEREQAAALKVLRKSVRRKSNPAVASGREFSTAMSRNSHASQESQPGGHPKSILDIYWTRERKNCSWARPMSIVT